jgi:hypothetical protein
LADEHVLQLDEHLLQVLLIRFSKNPAGQSAKHVVPDKKL